MCRAATIDLDLGTISGVCKEACLTPVTEICGFVERVMVEPLGWLRTCDSLE